MSAYPTDRRNALPAAQHGPPPDRARIARLLPAVRRLIAANGARGVAQRPRGQVGTVKPDGRTLV